MSWLTDLMASINKAQELYYTVNLKLEQIQKDAEELTKEAVATRTDCNGLAVRVTVLEESRNAIATEVEAMVNVAITKAIADMKVDYAEAKAEMLVKAAQAPGQTSPPALPSEAGPTS